MSEQPIEKAAKESAQSGTITGPTVVDRFRQYLDARVVEDKDKGGADVLNEKAVTAILTAETEDEVWDADRSGLIAFQNLVGCEIEIRALIVREGQQREDIDPGFFGTKWALVDCVAVAVTEDVEATTGLKPGDEFVADTGVATIIGKIRWFEANGKLPFHALVQGIATNNGNTILRLAKPPKRAVQGQASK